MSTQCWRTGTLGAVLLLSLAGCHGRNRSSPPPVRLLAATHSGFLWSVDVTAGASTRISGLGLRGLPDVRGLAYDASRDRLLATDAATNLIAAVDPRTWAVTVLGDSGVAGIEDLAVDPATGAVLGVTGSTLLTLDRETGAATPQSQMAVTNVFALARGNNTLYGHTYGNDDLLEIDPLTGSTRRIGGTGLLAVLGLCFDPGSGQLWTVDSALDALRMIDPATAVATNVGSVGFGTVAALTFDAVGARLLGFDLDACEIVAIDTATGAGVRQATLGVRNMDGLAYDAGADVLYGVRSDPSRIVRIDRGTAVVTQTIPLSFRLVRGLEFDPGRRLLFASDIDTGHLLTVDPATGAVAVVGALGLPSVEGLAFDAATNSLYGVDRLSAQLVRIDALTATVTAIGAVPNLATVGLTFHAPSGRLLLVDGSRVLSVDPATAQTNTLGDLPVVGVTGLAVGPTPDRVYAVRHADLIEFDLGAFAMRSVGCVGTTNLRGLASDPATGELRGADGQLGLVGIDKDSGETVTDAGSARPLEALAWDAGRATLFAVEVQGPPPSMFDLWASDWNGGNRRRVGTIGQAVTAIAARSGADPLLGVAEDRLLAIDPETAATSVIATMPRVIVALAWHPGSQALFGADGEARLWRIDPVTGSHSATAVRLPAGVRALAPRP